MTAAPQINDAEPGLVVLFRAPMKVVRRTAYRLPLSAETRKMMQQPFEASEDIQHGSDAVSRPTSLVKRSGAVPILGMTHLDFAGWSSLAFVCSVASKFG